MTLPSPGRAAILRMLLAITLGLTCSVWTFGLQEEAEAVQPPPLLVTGHEVFRNLVESPAMAEANPGLDWRFLLLNDPSVNAYSDAKGRVWVGGGLAEMLGQDRGLWAAVLSHEMAHCLLRHPSRSLATLHLAFPYVFGKMLRDREHRADLTGMMLMARAGYHPDSLFVVHHLLRAAYGDRPGAVAFFGSHPRWQSREQRLEQGLPEALVVFHQAWPDPALSPGGPPPLVVFLRKPRVVEDRGQKVVRILVSLFCRNATEPVTLVVKLEPKQPDIRRSVACPAAGPGSEAEVDLRADQFPARTLQVRMEILRADGALRAFSPRFSVRRPAP